ncbi:MAG: ATP synthase subunit alpha [Fuerstiella sp.]
MNQAGPIIEAGVVLAGPLEAVDREAVTVAVTACAERLQRLLPEYDWQFRLTRRDEWTSGRTVEPTELLQQVREERDESGWDFAFVVTHADLISHYKPFALAAISTALDVSVISTARIDPSATQPDSTVSHRGDVIQRRLETLMLHSLGFWLGLSPQPDESNLMGSVTSVQELSEEKSFSEDQLEEMRSAIAAIADKRLEEREDLQTASRWQFSLLAAWENRREILESTIRARPWQFPTRLSRLTTAAVSTVLVLLMTAETWDMAMSQSLHSVTVLFVSAIVGTTSYAGLRQQLFLRRNGRSITEQIVTSNVSAAVIFASGMTVMFLLLSLLALAAGWLLFPAEVIKGWAASVAQPIQWRHYLLLATTVGSLGIIIGALGASFEQQHYFRHVIFVDEEV